MTPEWEDLIQALLKEQGYICCYCMQRIYGEDSHIEHFVPRDIKNTDPHSMRASDVELNYGNLFESCNGEHWDWSHCGRFKDRDLTPSFFPLRRKISKKDSAMVWMDRSTLYTQMTAPQ